MRRKMIALLSTVLLAMTLSMTVCAADDAFPSLGPEYYETETETGTTISNGKKDTSKSTTTTIVTGSTTPNTTTTVRSDTSPKTGEGMMVVYIGAVGIALAGVAYSAKRHLCEMA